MAPEDELDHDAEKCGRRLVEPYRCQCDCLDCEREHQPRRCSCGDVIHDGDRVQCDLCRSGY